MPTLDRLSEGENVRGSASGAAVRALELLAGMGLAALVTASTAFASGNPLLPALPAHERRCSALHRARCVANLLTYTRPCSLCSPLKHRHLLRRLGTASCRYMQLRVSCLCWF